jgi:hypothetical protein
MRKAIPDQPSQVSVPAAPQLQQHSVSSVTVPSSAASTTSAPHPPASDEFSPRLVREHLDRALMYRYG